MGETISTFEQLIRICSSGTSFYMNVRRFKELTAMIIPKKNFEFEQWFRLSIVLTPSGDPHSDLQKFVFRNMEKYGTFKQWLRVRRASKPESETGELAMRKMVEKAKTFQHWLEVYKNANAAEYYLYSLPEYCIHNDFELAKLAVSKMSEKDGTFEQWFEAYNHCGPHRKLIWELAISKISEKDGTFEQWIKVLESSDCLKDPDFDNLLELAFNKLSGMSPTIKQWRAFLRVLKQ